MKNEQISRLLEELSKKSLLFKRKDFLDTLSIPAEVDIIGRDKEIEELVQRLSQFSYGDILPFISVIGKSGSGKSTTVKLVCNELENHYENNFLYRFVNLRKAGTIFGCANVILNELGEANVKSADGIGAAIDRIQRAIERIIQGATTKEKDDKVENIDGRAKKVFVLVLDEFDVLFRANRSNASDFIYSLLLIEEHMREQGHLMCIVAISNKIVIHEDLDERVLSRIGPSAEILFGPYKKQELSDILAARAEKAFTKPVDPAIIEYCIQLCSKEHRDARRAIDLLRRAAEIASYSTNVREIGTAMQQEIPLIEKKHVDEALDELQKDNVGMIVSLFSYQLRLVCASLARISYLTDEQWHSTSRLYNQYKRFIIASRDTPLTYRRFSQLLGELVDCGMAESQNNSKGRHGYGSQFRLTVPPEIIAQECLSKKDWYDLGKMKSLRRDFLLRKKYPKSERDFRKYQDPEHEKIFDNQMNDFVWEKEVDGRNFSDYDFYPPPGAETITDQNPNEHSTVPS